MEVLKNLYFALKNALQNFIKDRNFLFLSILFFAFLVMYWGKFGDPVIDCGREAYIPYAMADLGKVLFKDIICIYGPVPYYLNAFIVKIFGANLNTMYLIGALLSYLFLFGIYNLAKRFFEPNFAFLISAALLFICILNPSISNFIFPYSYAIVYALVFAVFHLIFLFKFIDNKETAINLYTSAFFLSLCLLSKLDFIPCILPFLTVVLKYRKSLNLKVIAGILTSFSIPFFMLILILIFQKVSFENLIFNFKMISNMAHSPSLQYFYTICTGYFFEFKKTFMFIWEFLQIALILTVSGLLGYFASKIKNIVFSIFLTLVIAFVSAILLFKLDLVRYIFTYLPLLVLAFFAVKCIIFLFKKFKNPALAVSDNDTVFYLLILFSLLFSLKTLFGLFHELYGTFYLPFILLSFTLIVFKVLRSGTVAKELCTTTCLTIMLLFLIQNFVIFLGFKNIPLKTPSGNIFADISTAHSINAAFAYIQNNIKNDSVLILPEGLFFNFAFKKEYQFFNTSFTPMDFDAYGEDYLTESLLANKPKYIILLPRDYNDYGKGFICTDFGLKFCDKINKIYKLKTHLNETEDTPPVTVFERKN